MHQRKSKLQRMRENRVQQWQDMSQNFVSQQLQQPSLHQRLRTQRAQMQQQAKLHSGGAFANVMQELRTKATVIHRHSATRSAANVSLEEHHRNVAGMLATENQQGRFTHDQYARRRYGQAGTTMLQQLRSIHPGMQDLIVDPALMSKTHLADFTEFAKALSNTRQQNEQSQLSPWQMRKEYEATLPKQTWYRGLKLGTALGHRLARQGIHSRVTRTLDSIQNDRNSQGIFKQTLNTKIHHLQNNNQNPPKHSSTTKKLLN